MPEPWTVLQSIAAHHSEPADPDLLEWIKGLLDHIFNFGPWTIVIVLALLIALIPVAIMGVYLVQQRRQPGNRTTTPEQEER